MNHSGAVPGVASGTITQPHPESLPSHSPASRACAEHGTGSMERGKGTGSRDRSYSPTRPTSRNVRALLATLAGWTRRRIDPHHDCRARHTATVTHVSERDHLRGWMAGVDSAHHALADWLEQRANAYREDARHLEARSRATSWQLAVAAELRQAAVDLNPSAPWPAPHLSRRTS